MTLNLEKLKKLIKEYEEDPNCWPAVLWIKGEDVTEEERKVFISTVLTKKLRLYKEKLYEDK